MWFGFESGEAKARVIEYGMLRHGKFWWKWLPSVPTMECGWGRAKVAWEDAVNRDLFILQGYILESWAVDHEDYISD